MAKTNLDALLADIVAGKAQSIYLVSGDLVVAEPQAVRLAEALAEKAGCEVDRHRRPAELSPILADLKTYSLFASAKVVLVIDSALFAERSSAAHLIDQAEEALPLTDPGSGLESGQREGASRLLQALRVFGVAPDGAEAGEVIASLPAWAFEGGPAWRKRRNNRKRGKKQVGELREGLAALLEAALLGGLEGFAEGDLAELGSIVSSGLPEGHSLVMAEPSAAADHPLVEGLATRGAVLQLGKVEAGKGGAWQGLEPLAAELGRETGALLSRGALPELARRTLRQSGDWKNRRVEADSTARFAAEYRKLASLAAGGEISKKLIEDSVEDRGEEDVWKILDALGNGHGGEALARARRYLSAADDTLAARLSFFSLLAGFCRQLSAVAGLLQVSRMPAGERNYNRFKNRIAPALQEKLATGGKSPVAGMHPFRLHRAYLAASRLGPELAASLPWLVLETETRLKGESSDADAALAQLMARVAAAR